MKTWIARDQEGEWLCSAEQIKFGFNTWAGTRTHASDDEFLHMLFPQIKPGELWLFESNEQGLCRLSKLEERTDNE